MPKTSIEWTDCTWNPVRGCSMAKGSEAGGCLNCYAARQSARNLPGLMSPTTGKPFAVKRGAGPRWTGEVEVIPHMLAMPLSWKQPRKCFVNSMSDLFHERLSFEDIAAVYGVMAACPHVTFQVLTKRPERRREFFSWLQTRRNGFGSIPAREYAANAAMSFIDHPAVDREIEVGSNRPWPLPNVWEGTSVENQETADRRIPELLATPAAIRFLSCEPLLGSIDLGFAGVLSRTIPQGFGTWPIARQEEYIGATARAEFMARTETVDWVIVGGESGPGARPMHPEWARSLRDQCLAAGVAFHFKQWGQFKPIPTAEIADPGIRASAGGDEFVMWPSRSKEDAGRLLDGREWNEFPEVAHG
jgi:protein gp37